MSKIDTRGFTDKDSKVPELRKLYEDHDFITAYAKHTDYRIEHRGTADAIGGAWEEYGDRQVAYLRSIGLKPHDVLLDLGCGTGRLARKITRYLEPGRYHGVDISMKAVASAIDLSQTEGWCDRNPNFYVSQDGGLEVVGTERFDFVWAHSVLLHLPPEAIARLLDDLRKISFREFHFTVVQDKPAKRVGLKQFCLPTSELVRMAAARGFTMTPLARSPLIAQPVARIVR